MAYHSVDRPQRKDAVRNRAALIQAAREVFARRGFEASMDDIAEHAGLGVGTAYRHFANKYVLSDAVFDDAVADFIRHAQAALDDPDPWAGLVGLIERLLEEQTDNRAIREIVLGRRQDDPKHHLAMTQAFVEPFERARAAGAVRRDTEVSDVGAIVLMLCTVTAASGERSPHLWRRYLPVLLAGLRPGGVALPVPALPRDELSLASA